MSPYTELLYVAPAGQDPVEGRRRRAWDCVCPRLAAPCDRLLDEVALVGGRPTSSPSAMRGPSCRTGRGKPCRRCPSCRSRGTTDPSAPALRWLDRQRTRKHAGLVPACAPQRGRVDQQTNDELHGWSSVPPGVASRVWMKAGVRLSPGHSPPRDNPPGVQTSNYYLRAVRPKAQGISASRR